MLEEYLKRLENLITPRSFSLTNFKDQNQISNNQQNLSKPIITETQDINNQLVNPNLSNNPGSNTDNSKQRLNTTEGEILPENFREIVHQLKIKNMNYRHDIHLLKQKIEDYEKQIYQKDNMIKKLQKQKEDDNKYLLKLEGVRAKDGVFVDPVMNTVGKKSETPFIDKSDKERAEKDKASTKKEGPLSQNFFSTTSVNPFNDSKNNFNAVNESGISNLNNVTGFENLKGLNLNDKKAVKEFALKIMTENKNLKGFKAKIYEVSKTYDTLNEKITNGLRMIKKYFEEIANLNSVEGGTLCNLASN